MYLVKINTKEKKKREEKKSFDRSMIQNNLNNGAKLFLVFKGKRRKTRSEKYLIQSDNNF